MGVSAGLAVATDAEAWVAARVCGALEAVFASVAATRADTAALLERVAVDGRRPASRDLAALRPGLHRRLHHEELVSGIGFVAAATTPGTGPTTRRSSPRASPSA
ncbi:hypothetical protein ACWDE9_39295, partial [Streptomyces olivaceoviridis]